MAELSSLSRSARALANALEPFVGSVYFAPEAHAAYERIGFGPSPGQTFGVQGPEFTAYFTSRGSLMGQVTGQVVASAFAVFNPAIVVPAVTRGWTITDAETIRAARAEGALGQLRRLLGGRPDGLDVVLPALERAVAVCTPEGRPLFAGAVSHPAYEDALARAWQLGDILREFRGDGHTIAWVSADLDAVEIGLLTELFWGIPMHTYLRTRGWTEEQVAAGQDRLRSRGLITADSFTDAGRALREQVEGHTDALMRRVVEAMGPELELAVPILSGWSKTVRDGKGYPPARNLSLTGTEHD